jgi:hypothetical protein
MNQCYCSTFTDAVLAEKGRGRPVMNGLIHADIPALQKMFAQHHIKFTPESVPEQTPFYIALGFRVRENVPPSEEGLIPMGKQIQKRAQKTARR